MVYNQIVQQINKMAYMIEEMEKFRFNYRIYNQDNHKFNQTFHEQLKNYFIFTKENHNRDTHKLYNYRILLEQLPEKIRIRYLANKIYKNISLLICIYLDELTHQVRITTKLLNLNGTYAKLHNRQCRKSITKYICNRSINLVGEYRISLNVETGELKFQSPHYSRCFQEKIQTLTNYLNLLAKNLTQHLRDSYEYILPILFLTDTQFGSHQVEIMTRLGERNLQQMHRFSQFMNVFLNLASETSNQQQDLNLNLRKEAESFQRLKDNRIQLDADLSSILLYSSSDPRELKDASKKEQLQLSFLERAYISERLELPLNQKSSIPNENFFVLNYIKVNKKISQTMLKKIKTGGFTTIYLSEIEYWYVGSYCVGVMQEALEKDTPPLKKYIIIKREDKNVVKLCGKSRVAHERFILTKIKFGISMFLPKYYLLAEKDNSYENDLLVDFISSPNLSDYIDKNRAVLSINTKIYFILMIGQALRYLKEYKIAHLDLKPSNIMTHRRLTLKLIDFGQSYHPDVKNHQPGFSMPYSAPENYCFMDSYDSKNDVFSLGVIMYELFIGRYPFFFYDQSLRHRIYTEGTYLNYWLEAPEETLSYGEPLILPTIYSIMAKCLRPDPSDRPELEWIALLFREFMQNMK